MLWSHPLDPNLTYALSDPKSLQCTSAAQASICTKTLNNRTIDTRFEASLEISSV